MAAKLGCGKIVLCLLLVLVPLACAGRAASTTTSTASGSGSSGQNLDVQKHLKNLNRPPVKSIKVDKNSLSFFFLSFSFYLFYVSSYTFHFDCITVFSSVFATMNLFGGKGALI